MQQSTFDINRTNVLNNAKNSIPHIFSSRDINMNFQNRKPQSVQQIQGSNNLVSSQKLYYMYQSLNQASVGIILLNQAKNIIYNNKQIKKLFHNSNHGSNIINSNLYNNSNHNQHNNNNNNNQNNNVNSNQGGKSILNQLLQMRILKDYNYLKMQQDRGRRNKQKQEGDIKVQQDKNQNKIQQQDLKFQSKVDKILDEQRQSRELQRNQSPKSKQRQDQYGSVIYNQYQSSKNISNNNIGQNTSTPKSNQLRKLTTVEVISSDSKNESPIKEKNKHHTYIGQSNNIEYNSLRNIGIQQSALYPKEQIYSCTSQVRTSQFLLNSNLNNPSINNINSYNIHTISNLNNTPKNSINSNCNNNFTRNSVRASTLQKHDRFIYNQNNQQFYPDYSQKKTLQCSIPNNIKKLFNKKNLNIEDIINFLIMFSISPINQRLNTDNQILSEGSEENNTSFVSLKESNFVNNKQPTKKFSQQKLKDNLTQVEDNDEEEEDEDEEDEEQQFKQDEEDDNENEELDVDINLREDRQTEKNTKGGRSTGRGGQSTAAPGIEKESVIVDATTTVDTGRRTKSLSQSKVKQKMYNYFVQNNYLHFQVDLNEELENVEDSSQMTLLEVKLSVLVEIEDQLEEKQVLIEIQDITKLKKFLENENIDIYKNKILSSVSHELRTPLNCSIQMLDMLTQNEDIPDMLKQIFVVPALNSNILLLNIINDILDLAQINYGQFTMIFSEVELHKICMECINLISMQALQKNLELELELDPFIPQKINSDSNRIRQVLLNLLSNALKFTQNGKILIRTQLIEENLIQIDIEDTGCGIPQKNLNAIIGRFGKKDNQWQNLNKENQLNTIGVGLGLTIANNLASGLGGNRRLQVQSLENVGSKFSFCIVNHPLNKVGCNFQYKDVFSQEIIKWDYVSEYSQKQQNQQYIQIQFDSANISNKQNNTNGVPQSLINISVRSKKKNEESNNNLQNNKYQPIQSLIRFNTEILMNNNSVHNHYSHLNNIVNPKNDQSYSMLQYNQNSQLDGVKRQKYQLSFKEFSQYEDQGSIFENNLYPQPQQVFKSKPSDQSNSRLMYIDNITDHMKQESLMSIRAKNDSDQINENHQKLNSQFSPAHFNRSYKNYENSFSMLSYQEIRNRQNSRGQYQQNKNNQAFIRPNSELLPQRIQSSLQNQSSIMNNTQDSKNIRLQKSSLQNSDKEINSSNDNQQTISQKKKAYLSQYKSKEDQLLNMSIRLRRVSDQNEESCNVLINNSDIQNIQEPNFFTNIKVSQKRVNDASQLISNYTLLPRIYQSPESIMNENTNYSEEQGVIIKFNDHLLNQMYENDNIKEKYLSKDINVNSDSFTQIRESVEWGSMWNKTTEEIKQNDKNSINNLRDSIVEGQILNEDNKQPLKCSPSSDDSRIRRNEQRNENIKYILDKKQMKLQLQQSEELNKHIQSKETQSIQNFESSKLTLSAENIFPTLELQKNKSSADNAFKEKLQDYNKNRTCKCSNILIVDDTEFNILALEIRLKQYGFVIETATSGTLAIQLVKKKYEEGSCCKFYSIIFMDIDMPTKNGYQTTVEILDYYNQNNIQKPPPISACTAYIQQSEKTKALQVGMKYYLTKPVNQKQIEEILISAIINQKSNK